MRHDCANRGRDTGQVQTRGSSCANCWSWSVPSRKKASWYCRPAKTEPIQLRRLAAVLLDRKPVHGGRAHRQTAPRSLLRARRERTVGPPARARVWPMSSRRGGLSCCCGSAAAPASSRARFWC